MSVPLRSPLSIRNAVLLAVVASVFLPMLALWSVEQDITRRANEPLLEQNRRALLASTATALVEPLWSIDDAATRRAAQAALDGSGVLALRLVENRPNVEPLVMALPGHRVGEGLMLRTELRREGERLGELEMWFDPSQIDRMLAERRQVSLALAVVQTLLGVLVLVALLYHRLIAPIQRLKQQASDIATRADVQPVEWGRRDELGQLGQHLNEVHGQIDQLFDQLEAQKAELEKIALHDALTGLPNRKLFRELTRAAVAAAERDGTRLALLFIDLDRFKAVNDTLGHAAGDVLLQTLARRLSDALRSADVVCRHSGDEFTVLLHDAAHWDEVGSTAERLLQVVEASVPVGHGREAAVTASIGIALFPGDAQDPDTLIGHADTAMYAAKQLGRARHSFFRREFNAQLLASQRLERELQQALEQEQFELHFQPQVSAVTGETLGCEALIRWRHPERGLVPPGEFIAAAEQCGLIADIGAFAVRAACRQIAQWRAEGLPFGTVAVNVSALEFRSHRLLDTLTQAMAEFGVRAHELEIEITESVLMTDTDSTQRIVARLHALGLPLAVDDFGTGYSSLAYLKHLRPAKVKIDRSFVRDLDEDPDDRVLVQAIVRLAHALGIRVVAEGVETEGQQAFLRGVGCEVLQGYLISRPVQAPAFAAFVQERGLPADATLRLPVPPPQPAAEVASSAA